MSTPSSSFDFQNFYEATLTSDIASNTLTIPLSSAPTPSEGILVIDPDSASPECIFYTSKGASSVTCPADGRAWDSTTAQAFTQGTTVIMAPTAYMWRMLKSGSLYDSYATGWVNTTAPATITANGNRSYQCVVSGTDLTSTLSKGMRLKLTRTVAAPTQCTSLNGTTQYYNKTSPSGMTFTDDFVVSAWVKLSAYSSSDQIIASRYNGTSGWALYLTASTGTVTLLGYNGGAANYRGPRSYQSIPLNKWVHITAQCDMSSNSATTTTSYVMIDGVDVPAQALTGGTNPTALIQAGNLEIGSQNGGSQPFSGKIAQVAIYSAKVTQATILASMNQALSGSETSLVSAYSFNNSINDLSANANNLTAQGSAVATNADSPFGNSGASSTLEYGIITAISYSSDTTMTVQVPEGCALPTTGGITSMTYSSHKAPFGMPIQRGKWQVLYLAKVLATQSSPTQNTWYNLTSTSGTSGGTVLNIPLGAWVVAYFCTMRSSASLATIDVQSTLSTANNSESDSELTSTSTVNTTGLTTANFAFPTGRSKELELSTATPYYLNVRTTTASMTDIDLDGAKAPTIIKAELALL